MSCATSWTTRPGDCGGNPMTNRPTRTLLICKRCGYSWLPWRKGPPLRCANPDCRSTRWDKLPPEDLPNRKK